MSFKEITEAFPWTRYSKKLKENIGNPRSAGFFTGEQYDGKNIRMAEGIAGNPKDSNFLILQWLVDKEDGMILDAKFRSFGQTALIGAAEAGCRVCIGKNYEQATRLSTELIDREMRDKSDIPAFPRETFPHLNLILEAIEDAAQKCTDIPLPIGYIAPPVPSQSESGEGEPYPGWDELPLKKKIAVIESVLDSDVRPYIALDAGGVQVLNLLNDRELIISYEGSCTSCYSAIGTTLSYIQQTLRHKVHPDITVTPDLESIGPY